MNHSLRIVGEGHGPDRSPSRPATPVVGATGGQSPDLVFILDSAGTILYSNRSLRDIPQDDLLGASLLSFIMPVHQEMVRGVLDYAFANGQPTGFETGALSGDADDVWYDCRVVPTLRDERVVSATVIARDVTMRKHVEDDLRREIHEVKDELLRARAELARAQQQLAAQASGEVQLGARFERFRQSVDHAGDAIFLVDDQSGQVVDANLTACYWVDIPRDQLVGRTEAQLDLRFRLRRSETVSHHVADTRGNQRPKFHAGEHRRSDGSTFPVEIATTVHRFDGRTYILAIIREATARASVERQLFESEDRFNALFELSRDAIYLTNRDGTIAEVNDSAMVLFGYDLVTLKGLEAHKLYARPEQIQEFQREVVQHGFARDMDVEIVDGSGRTFAAFLTATLRRSSGNRVLGYQCVIREAPPYNPTAVPITRQELEAAESQRQATILLVEENPRARREIRRVLELAGLRVLVGESLAEARVIFQARAEEIGVMLIAGDPADVVNADAFLEIRRLRPGARVVVMGDETEQAIVEHLAAAGLAGIARTPVHPLGLIQTVRAALASETPPDNEPNGGGGRLSAEHVVHASDEPPRATVHSGPKVTRRRIERPRRSH